MNAADVELPEQGNRNVQSSRSTTSRPTRFMSLSILRSNGGEDGGLGEVISGLSVRQTSIPVVIGLRARTSGVLVEIMGHSPVRVANRRVVSHSAGLGVRRHGQPAETEQMYSGRQGDGA
ncbi:hypothetical protein CDEST_06808 [Colletotrichum destructivum]|uniref:Uncharacterized protein n=1 Tax=Colletotrichum destructivum TaxID=34406 RepID=A0AAX4IES8_9PEZI|nr:hypothetical protein CDEST_06808 [Colletotrichum destructivum]